MGGVIIGAVVALVVTIGPYLPYLLRREPSAADVLRAMQDSPARLVAAATGGQGRPDPRRVAPDHPGA